MLAILRNLAIGIIRHATYRTVNIAAATRQLARQPNVTLDLLGIAPLLCKWLSSLPWLPPRILRREWLRVTSLLCKWPCRPQRSKRPLPHWP